jgi:hypothetical protein
MHAGLVDRGVLDVLVKYAFVPHEGELQNRRPAGVCRDLFSKALSSIETSQEVTSPPHQTDLE